MDRSWISRSKPGDSEYEAGIRDFINFAVRNNKGSDRLPCPCFKCHNVLHKRVDEILNHLSKWAFDNTYTCWWRHGEQREGQSSGTSFANKTCEGEEPANDVQGENLDDMIRVFQDKFDDNPDKFEKLISDSEKPLYEGCEEYTKLSSILKLYNLKAAYGWSDKSFSDLLSLVKNMLPKDNVLPRSTYEAKKTLSTMGLPYEKIHACRNDCILYRNEHESLESCPICNASRYKKKNGIPAKVLWYFPIIPRFKRLFANASDAEKLTWHSNGRKKDHLLRHPGDSPQWRFIDGMFPEFCKEERNLRLALSTDGINPYGSLSSIHSTWPVILVTYNLPPSLCMKRRYMMLSLLISGPKQPGHNIDVYLAPLLDDLMLLWEQGVEAFDAYRRETFNLRAILFCTLQDFPAYGNLSGYTVKGKTACPICEDGLKGEWLANSKKMIYMKHRCFLPMDHPYRKLKKAFNGKQEFEERPKVSTSEEVFEKVKGIKTTFGKKHKSTIPTQGYKKCSCFFRLPYWKFLFVRHSLDVMHIEKNVFDSVVGTLLNIPGKSKDGLQAREDLKELNIRQELHVVEKNNKKYLPPAAYTLSRKEKKEFCESLAGVKVPEGFSSNIQKLVSTENVQLVGLKSHDCHILMQYLLPVAIRSILPKNVRYAIIRLCCFFNAIYSKVIDPKDLKILENEIIVILCQLEMYFPPSFFDIMIHLTIHLVREVRFCGPVYLRNQWAFERQNKVYKGYVKNPYRPEACIAERLFFEDAIRCSSDFLDVKDIGIPISRHDGKLQGKGTIGHKRRDLSNDQWRLAHTYVLLNERDVAPYVEQHMVFLRNQNRKATERSLLSEHYKTFHTWLKGEVTKELQHPSNHVSDRLKSLAYGPTFNASFYSGYAYNGYTFYTRAQDENSTMQNSGVTLEAEAMHFASAKDKRPIRGKMQYYGIIEEIFELNYIGFSIPIFGCKWVDNNSGVEYDDLANTTFVNFDKLGHKEDPYILASQARQVFYMTDPSDKKRLAVITPRRRHDMDDSDDDDDDSDYDDDDSPLEDGPSLKMKETQMCSIEDSSTYVRADHIEGTWIETKSSKGSSKKRPRTES